MVEWLTKDSIALVLLQARHRMLWHKPWRYLQVKVIESRLSKEIVVPSQPDEVSEAISGGFMLSSREDRVCGRSFKVQQFRTARVYCVLHNFLRLLRRQLMPGNTGCHSKDVIFVRRASTCKNINILPHGIKTEKKWHTIPKVQPLGHVCHSAPSGNTAKCILLARSHLHRSKFEASSDIIAFCAVSPVSDNLSSAIVIASVPVIARTSAHLKPRSGPRNFCSEYSDRRKRLGSVWCSATLTRK